ncbi:MAG: hypothetical protein JXR75_14665 [Rhodobacteraceae bacterium]|nr:hypothetical protein [Paracoccaceae bacterium]
MADIVVKAAYGSVVEEDGMLFVGFAEGEDDDDDAPYVLFRQPLEGGAVWFEATDPAFGAEDAVQSVIAGPKGLTITIRPDKVAKLGWASTIDVRIGPGCEDASQALDALRVMLGDVMQG